MATIGRDCEIVLDGMGYFVKPASYQCKQPRIRQISYRADGGLAYVDHGPGKRVWSMIVLAHNELVGYDGMLVGWTGQQYRDTLYQSYTQNIATAIAFIGPLGGSAVQVYFDAYSERVLELRSLLVPLAIGGNAGLVYEVSIELLEA